MSVFTTDTPVSRHAKTPRTEFYAYFTIIFLAALPLALVQWMLAAVRSDGKPNRGMVARAWTHAREIAPMIFSA